MTCRIKWITRFINTSINSSVPFTTDRLIRTYILISDFNLKSSFYFDRCTDPSECNTFTSGLLCQACHVRDNTSIVIPTDPLDDSQPWSCSKCHNAVSNLEVEKKMAKLTDDIFNQECEDDEVKFTDFLMDQRHILHPNHFLMTSTRISWLKQKMLLSARQARNSIALDISISEQLEIADVALQLLKLADILAPGLTKVRGKKTTGIKPERT